MLGAIPPYCRQNSITNTVDVVYKLEVKSTVEITVSMKMWKTFILKEGGANPPYIHIARES